MNTGSARLRPGVQDDTQLHASDNAIAALPGALGPSRPDFSIVKSSGSAVNPLLVFHLLNIRVTEALSSSTVPRSGI
jgi:hypothetical protein